MIITEEKALERLLSLGFCDTAIPISIRQQHGEEAEITVLPSLKKVAKILEKNFDGRLFSKDAHAFLRESIRPFMDTIGFLDNRQSRKISLIMTLGDVSVTPTIKAVRLKTVSDYSKNLTTAPIRDLIELGHTVCAVLDGESVVCVAYTNLPPNAKMVEVGIETAPKYRRRGYAKDCMRALITELAKIGAEPIYYCSQSNTGSVKLARSLGFESEAIEYDYVFRRK